MLLSLMLKGHTKPRIVTVKFHRLATRISQPRGPCPLELPSEERFKSDSADPLSDILTALRTPLERVPNGVGFFPEDMSVFTPEREALALVSVLFR
jgi:hypothetical protein